MSKFELCSSCDDAGELLAARLGNSDFVRVIETHETKEEAESAKQEWMDWYADRNVAIGEGCLLIRENAQIGDTKMVAEQLMIEQMMLALAKAHYSGSEISWQLGLDGEPNHCFRIRWESANVEQMIVRGYAESCVDDSPPAVIGRIDVELDISYHDGGSVIIGDFRIMSKKPEWLGPTVGCAIILESLGTAIPDESIWGNAFEEEEAR